MPTIFLLDSVLENPRGKMAVGIHGYDFLGITPLWEGANLSSGFRIGEVRTVPGVSP